MTAKNVRNSYNIFYVTLIYKKMFWCQKWHEITPNNELITRVKKTTITTTKNPDPYSNPRSVLKYWSVTDPMSHESFKKPACVTPTHTELQFTT